jgi:[ribosomal protein S5]-alanine N-acetyltransferase
MTRQFCVTIRQMSEPPPPVPDLATDRLRLRRLAIEDAPNLHQAYGDAEAMRFWNAPPSRDLAETEQRIRRSLSSDATSHTAWAILSQDDGRFIGMVNYHARQAWNHRLAVGWILVPGYWGQGYMQEAMRALLTHCFEALDTHRIEAEIEPENVRSARLADRLGFRREGLMRDVIFVADQPRSIWMYALLRPEWDCIAPLRTDE